MTRTEHLLMLENPYTQGWRRIARDKPDAVRECILTGFAKTGHFHAEEGAFNGYKHDRRSVLDFGCGMGRNAPMLSKEFEHITGYDLPEMLKRMPAETLNEHYDHATVEWPIADRFSCIFAALVLQHISEAWMRRYLEDFQRMAPYLMLRTRWYTDDGYKAVLPIVLDYFLPDNPQFRLSDALQARTAPDDQTHLSVLLKSR